MAGKHSYEEQVSTRKWWQRLVRTAPTATSLAAGMRQLAHQARGDQPIDPSISARMEATAALLTHAAQRAEQLMPILKSTMRAEEERHDAPYAGSQRLEAKRNAGHVIRGS